MVEPKPSGVRPRALPSAVLLCSVLFFLPGVFAYPYQAMSPTGYMCQGWYAEMYSYDSISPQDCQALCSDSSNCGAMTFQGADGSVGRDYSVCACSTARPLLSPDRPARPSCRPATPHCPATYPPAPSSQATCTTNSNQSARQTMTTSRTV